MSRLVAQRIVELPARDERGAGAATTEVLNAYLHAEQLHVFRRLFWRRLVLIALLWTAAAAVTSFISPSGLMAGLAVLAVGGAGALAVERQAAKALQRRLRDCSVESPS